MDSEFFLIGDKWMSQCFKYHLTLFLIASIEKYQSSIIVLPIAKLTFELLPTNVFL